MWFLDRNSGSCRCHRHRTNGSQEGSALATPWGPRPRHLAIHGALEDMPWHRQNRWPIPKRIEDTGCQLRGLLAMRMTDQTVKVENFVSLIHHCSFDICQPPRISTNPRGERWKESRNVKEDLSEVIAEQVTNHG